MDEELAELEQMIESFGDVEGHRVGFAALPSVGVAVACSCGQYEDTWKPWDKQYKVVGRFQRHVKRAK